MAIQETANLLLIPAFPVLLTTALGVLVDHADGALVLEVVVEELGRDVVLDDLVLEDAEARLLGRELGELHGVLEPGDDHRPDDPVDRLQIEAAELAVKTSESQIRSSEAGLVQAKSQLNTQEVNLGHTVIRAPIDGIVISSKASGIVTEIAFQSGSEVVAGQVLLRLDRGGGATACGEPSDEALDVLRRGSGKQHAMGLWRASVLGANAPGETCGSS